MRKNALILMLLAFGFAAADDVITLDLTKATTTLEFDTANGSWTDTFNEDVESIESQVFSFVHSAMSEYNTWWGFTASNAANNAQPSSYLSFQWSNMAAGGVSIDEQGNVTADATVPYLVGYYGEFFSARPTDMVFNDGNNYEPQGVYVNLTSYPYYVMIEGDSFTRAFANGDNLNLIIHGVAPDESEKEVTVNLCSYSNGDITINRGWKYVDLTSLGTVNELYFTMTSTDTGEWGINTPTYFALDKLSVKPAANDAIVSVSATATTLKYDRAAKQVTFGGTDFAVLQNVVGQTIMTSTSGTMDISALPAGVYIARAGSRVLKLAK